MKKSYMALQRRDFYFIAGTQDRLRTSPSNLPLRNADQPKEMQTDVFDIMYKERRNLRRDPADHRLAFVLRNSHATERTDGEHFMQDPHVAFHISIQHVTRRLALQLEVVVHRGFHFLLVSKEFILRIPTACQTAHISANAFVYKAFRACLELGPESGDTGSE